MTRASMQIVPDGMVAESERRFERPRRDGRPVQTGGVQKHLVVGAFAYPMGMSSLIETPFSYLALGPYSAPACGSETAILVRC